jgi:hypothetical protein
MKNPDPKQKIEKLPSDKELDHVKKELKKKEVQINILKKIIEKTKETK